VNKMKIQESDVTKKDVKIYEACRRSGVPMWKIRKVEMATGLSRPKIEYIMEHYTELIKKYNIYKRRNKKEKQQKARGKKQQRAEEEFKELLDTGELEKVYDGFRNFEGYMDGAGRLYLTKEEVIEDMGLGE